MSAPTETKPSKWTLPGLLLWGFAPALVLAFSIIGGWYSGDYGIISPGRPGFGQSRAADLLIQLTLMSMPIVLYLWGVAVLVTFGRKRNVITGLLGIPIAIVMCIANVVLGITGCNVLTNIVPKEGIF